MEQQEDAARMMTDLSAHTATGRDQQGMEWWKDDPELLDAALFMLSGEDANDGSGETSSEARPATVKKKRGRRQQSTSRPPAINVSRERQREEIRNLRDEAVELEAQLAALRLRREEQLRPHITENGQATSVAVYWEDIATRQFRERKRSELLNSKLKLMRDTQQRIADDLVSAIRRAEELTQQNNAEGIIELDAKPKARLPIDISQKVSEEEQLERLQWLCTQTDEAFARYAKFTDPTTPKFIDTCPAEDDNCAVVLDSFSSHALPFSLSQVEDALWRFVLERGSDEESNPWAREYQSKDDGVIIGVSEAVTNIDGLRTVFNGKYVIKPMRDQKGRLMVVFHSFSVGKHAGNVDDIELDEDCWLRVIDAREIGDTQLGSPLSLIQHVRRFRVNLSRTKGQGDQLILDESRRLPLFEYLRLQVEDELRRTEQALENILLEIASEGATSTDSPLSV